ncbi:hypothetical protein [Nocardia fusca]|uniref:hypothetical protein n=1 Tax=Nocardia fusca TaxID=941183 RepID=UPI0007A73753|nr:hypothetical protein [Nocardia fusca]
MAANKQTPIRQTPEYQAIQHDERFQGWLRMQEAAMDIEFTNYDVPELNGHLYTREGLVIAEHQILQRYPTYRDMFSPDNLKIAMRFVYAIGETFRRAIDGTWVALPPNPPERPAPLSVIDSPMWTAFHDPQHMIGLAFNRRTEKEITFIYDRAVKRHQKWIDAGRPARDS